jgi:hypothetical protein
MSTLDQKQEFKWLVIGSTLLALQAGFVNVITFSGSFAIGMFSRKRNKKTPAATNNLFFVLYRCYTCHRNLNESNAWNCMGRLA